VHRILEAMPELPRGGLWLDPCAGDGAIIKAARMLEPDTRWRATELREECAEVLSAIPNCTMEIKNFLTPSALPAELADVVLMNPPYRLAQEFVVEAMRMARYVVVLLRLNFLGSDERVEWLRAWPPDVKVLPNRPKFRAGPGTDSIEYAWMVWDSTVLRASGTVCVLPSTPGAERGVRVRKAKVAGGAKRGKKRLIADSNVGPDTGVAASVG